MTGLRARTFTAGHPLLSDLFRLHPTIRGSPRPQSELVPPIRKALWERDKQKLMFPYGLHPDDDVINYPPAVQIEEVDIAGVTEPNTE